MKTRFIQSIVKTSGEAAPKLPWTRGATRRATIAKRAAPMLRSRRA